MYMQILMFIKFATWDIAFIALRSTSNKGTSSLFNGM